MSSEYYEKRDYNLNLDFPNHLELTTWLRVSHPRRKWANLGGEGDHLRPIPHLLRKWSRNTA